MLSGKLDRGELTIEIAPEKIVSVCGFLKYDLKFVRLSTVTGVDWYPAEPRFEVVYHLHSLDRNERLRVKCRLPGADPEIDSVTGSVARRELVRAGDFRSVRHTFRNHPDLRRIMMPDDWEGHPLRKDYRDNGRPGLRQERT